MTITIKHLDNGFKHNFNSVLSAENFLNIKLTNALLRLRNKDLEFYGDSKDIYLWKNNRKTNFIITYD